MLHLVINNFKKEHHNHNNPSKHNREVSGHNLAATQLNITTKRNCRIIILKFLKPNQLTPWCVWNGAVRELACNHHHTKGHTLSFPLCFSLYPTKATNKHKTITQPPNERLYYTFLSLSLSPLTIEHQKEMLHPLGPANVSRPFATSSKILRRSRNSAEREREDSWIASLLEERERERERERETQKGRSEGGATKPPSFPLSRWFCFWVSLRFPRRRCSRPVSAAKMGCASSKKTVAGAGDSTPEGPCVVPSSSRRRSNNGLGRNQNGVVGEAREGEAREEWSKGSLREGNGSVSSTCVRKGGNKDDSYVHLSFFVYIRWFFWGLRTLVFYNSF